MVESVMVSPAYSLLIDESIDREHVRQVVILFMLTSFEFTCFFNGLYDIPQANAANLLECLDLQLKRDGLILQAC